MPPIYLFLTLWGLKYTDYFVNYCIPSLLSKGNIPSVINPKNRFLIACPEREWNLLQKKETFINLKKFIKVQQLKIEYPKKNEIACEYMGKGHLIATNLCFENKALGVALTPDLILSDSCLNEVKKSYFKGKDTLLLAAVRFEKENFFKNLNKYFKSFNKKMTTQDISSRVLTKIVIQSLHSQARYYLESNKNIIFGSQIPTMIFHGIKKNDLILHNMSWMPLFINYAKIKKHDTSAIENSTLDADYLSKNFHDYSKIEVISDSDKAMVVSWCDRNEGVIPENNSILFRFIKKYPTLLNKLKMIVFRANAASNYFDNMKRHFLSTPIFFHSDGIDNQLKKISEKTKIQVDLQFSIIEKIFLRFLIALEQSYAFFYRGTNKNQKTGESLPPPKYPFYKYFKLYLRGFFLRDKDSWIKATNKYYELKKKIIENIEAKRKNPSKKNYSFLYFLSATTLGFFIIHLFIIFLSIFVYFLQLFRELRIFFKSKY